MQRSSCVVFLDLSAAFDTVDHSILLERLMHVFRVNDVVYKWFSSYLSHRFQCVYADGLSSSWCLIKQGVPQGSVLGPLLFSMYISPISNLISSYGLSHHVYADDISIFSSFDSAILQASFKTIRDCTSHLLDWCNANRLKLNPDKSEVLVCPSHSCPVPNSIFIGDSIVSPSPCVRYLGVLFDSSLSFEGHVNQMCRSSFAFVRDVWRIRSFIKASTVLQLIHAYVFSKLDYCNSILAQCPSYRIRQLQRVQNSCVRVITRIPRYAHVTPFLRQLRWLPVRCRIEFKVCCMLHRCVYGSPPAPAYLQEIVRLADSSSINISLRSQAGPVLHQPLTSKRRSCGSLSIVGPRLWNSLPLLCRAEPSLRKFKKLLKTELLNRF